VRGRELGGYEVCHFTTCYLGDDRRACLDQAKRMLARYANLPFYGNMLVQCGYAREVEAVRAAWKTKDAAAAEAAVSDAMAEGVTLIGDPAECRRRIRAYRMAGADRIVVFPNPVGEPRAAAVARALDGLRPR
jgi:alkanesulfonate monooxygenase SsuD/methylene tetrahydromethanopterin reductase-like flavin-dependent oxidoreductase (luciferase family)